MTDAQIAAAIIGFFAPLLIAAVQRTHWPDQARYVVALGGYVVLTLFVWLYENHVDRADDWRDYVRLFAPMFVAAVSSFQLLWKNALAQKIEDKTNG